MQPDVWIGDFIAEENIECNFGVVGRFYAAHNEPPSGASQKLANEPEGFKTGGWAAPRIEQRKELGTDAYFGGVVYPRHASLDPGRFHQGLLERVLRSGATVACPLSSDRY